MRIENFNLRYVQHWTDHLGRQRYRIRRKGHARIELPVDGDPRSPEFLAAYHAALRGEQIDQAVKAVTARVGTVRDAIDRYLSSTTFRDDYSPSTQNLRRPMLRLFEKPLGHLPLAKLDRECIEAWMETAPTKGAKRTRLLALKPWLAWSVNMNLIAADPTEGIKAKAKPSEGHATWSDAEIEQFRAHHPVGTRARLALELMLCAASRRGDGIALGRQHLKDGWLIFTQEKNRKRKPVTVEVPVSIELAAAIEACPSPPEALTFLVNDRGLPFTKGPFGHWFRAQITAAGLPEACVAHGLRKAACRIMAESECTPHEIKSVSGHRTLKEVERYTDAVNNRRLAARAKAKVAGGKVVPLREVV